jgi:flagellar hook-associated protein 1 FlgK
MTDTTQLTAQDYVLRYEGGDNFSLLAQPKGTVVDTFNAPSGTSYTTAEGFSISINAGLTQGDRFEIRPTRSAAQDIAVLSDDVTDIAAAGAVRAYDSGANQGDATISAGELITDPADPEYINFFDPAAPAYVPPANFTATVSPVTIDFQTSGAGTAPYADEYSLDGGTTWLPYTSGADIKLDGMKVQISGTPIEGDQFTMEPNTGAVSDNRNMLELAGLQNARTLVDGGNGPTVDFQGAYGQLVSMVGTKTHQADVAGKAQESLLNQAVASREAVSGVNLDEEAANLLRFQQAYQATARVVTSAQTMFQSLLDAVR